MAKEKSKSESSGPLRGEMPEVVAASGSTATWCRFLPKMAPFFAATDTQIQTSGLTGKLTRADFVNHA
jgi:hypothetical protein